MHRILLIFDLSVPALLLLVALLLGTRPVVHGSNIEHGTWDYESRGPSTWAKSFPQYCSGRKQSPINLSLADSLVDPKLSEYSIRETENAQFTLTLSNDGHKLLVSMGSDLVIKIGQGDKMYYTASQLHWHWGADNSRGSEHTMEGRAYPLEGHLVFYNSYDYANFSVAVHRVGGLAVLGVFYELSDTDNPLLLRLEPYLPQLVNFKTSVDVKFNSSDFNFVDAFLPKYRRYFYRYEGGLTTPTCNENVLWTVFRSASQVSARQLKLLRSLRYPSGKAMVDNYRPPQPLNSPHRPGANRLVYRTFDRRGRASGDSGFLVDVPGDTCGALGSAGGASAVALLLPAAVLSGWRAIY
ncbi:hypothetical protein BOX15_Mlig003660g5 [Macrostomum lignano]|uniref:Uncharacterized protein n=2 Tax=Macrostomum lignano TaxID=282301 RepID=A0A267FY46_9PLAT|nr:hypothetical protein BOX15_Mlig003660g5 [Macrostomum lignano]